MSTSNDDPTLVPPSVSSAPVVQKSRNPLVWVLGLSAGFFALFLVGAVALFFVKDTDRAAGALFGNGSVGVLEVTGVIMDSKKTLEKLKELEERDDVKAIVVRVNSPGGAVGPSQEIYDSLKASKKPVVASMASIAASGGYYISCAAKKIFANPGTLTGSIGVIMEFMNLEKLYEWAKVKRYAIKTGKFKATGADYKDMTAEEHALMQALVDDVLRQFRQAVVDGRKLPLDKVVALSDGRVFSGSQAKAVKLVDELGGMEQAVEEAAKLGGIKGKARVVYPSKARKGLFQVVLEEASGGGGDDEAEGHSSLFADGLRWLRVLARGDAPSLNTPSLGILPAGLYWLWRHD